jgi:hypothetical protein
MSLKEFNMKKTILYLILASVFIILLRIIAFSESNPRLVGFLPGTDYKYFMPLQKIDLQGRTYKIEIIDARANINKVDCFGEIDRDTELEGDPGLNYFRNYLTTMIENCNGRVSPESNNEIIVKLEGLSFMTYGIIFIGVHGLVQFEVISPGLTKRYCADMADDDNDSPLNQCAVITRKTSSRLIVSGSIRRALESLMIDLQK